MLNTLENITNTGTGVGTTLDPWRLPASRTQTARGCVVNCSAGEQMVSIRKEEAWESPSPRSEKRSHSQETQFTPKSKPGGRLLYKGPLFSKGRSTDSRSKLRFLHMCMWACKCTHICICVCVIVFMCAHSCTCVCTRMHMCVHVLGGQCC